LLGKVGVFVVKNLKFIPILGGLISFGFAISRFRKGDWIGGMIDVVSGILGMVPPGPWSFVTVPLAIGLSVLNAILDAKSGGATGKQTGAKTDMLKRWAAAFFSFIYKIPPLSYIYNLAQGIIQGVQGNWKASANHLMYAIPIVGSVLEWFSIGGFKDPEGEPIKGDRQGFFNKAIEWMTKLPPLRGLISLAKGLGAVFQGKWGEAAWHFMYAIPFVGALLQWFDVGQVADPDKKEIGGSKQGFFSKVFGWIVKLPPISNIIHVAKGIGAVFSGEWLSAAKHFMYAIPIVGNLLEWFGVGGEVGASTAEKIPEKRGFLSSIVGWITGLFPISNFVNLYKGIKAVFAGQWLKAGKHFMYTLPIIGNVLEWFGVGESLGEPSSSDLPKKEGFLASALKGALRWGWGTVKWLLGKIFWPVKKILEWTGFLDNMPSGAAEDVPAGGGSGGKRISSSEMVKRSKYGAIKQYAGTWKSIGSVGRWVARKFLDEETENLLDTTAWVIF
jgi:hypothetical protein